MTISTSAVALASSARAHLDSATSLTGAQADLMEFYGTECAMKSKIVELFKARGWSELPDDVMDRNKTHDLKVLAKTLNLGSEARDLRECRRRGTAGGASGPVIKLKDVHSAWRYGAKMWPADEQRLRNGMRHVQATLGF